MDVNDEEGDRSTRVWTVPVIAGVLLKSWALRV